MEALTEELELKKKMKRIGSPIWLPKERQMTAPKNNLSETTMTEEV